MDKYDIVVFDLDGTLLDTTEGVSIAIKYTINKHGLSEISEDVLKTFMGPPIQSSFERVFELEGDIIQELATTFRNRYKDFDLLKAVPYNQIYDVFDALSSKGIKTAIATYKRQDLAEAILKHFNFDKYTNILYGADNQNKLKKRDIIEKALKDSSVTDLRRAVMIGDSSHDAIGAEEIGIDFIGVTYGFEFKTKDDVYRYKCVGAADTALEILNYL